MGQSEANLNTNVQLLEGVPEQDVRSGDSQRRDRAEEGARPNDQRRESDRSERSEICRNRRLQAYAILHR